MSVFYTDRFSTSIAMFSENLLSTENSLAHRVERLERSTRRLADAVVALAKAEDGGPPFRDQGTGRVADGTGHQSLFPAQWEADQEPDGEGIRGGEGGNEVLDEFDPGSGPG